MMLNYVSIIIFYNIDHQTFASVMYDRIKKYLDDKRSFIDVVISLLTTIVGISGLITQLLASKIAIVVTCIGLFFLIKIFTDPIIKHTRSADEKLELKYSGSQRKNAKRIYYLSFVLIIIPFLIFGHDIYKSVYNSFLRSRSVAVVISDFSRSNDDFSDQLYRTLDEKLQNADSIKLSQLRKYIMDDDSISQIFRDYGNKGLMIYGKRKNSIFDCRIFIVDLFNTKTNSALFKNGKKIYLPNILNFSLEDQSATVAQFILGLMYFHSENYDSSIGAIREALRLTNSGKNIDQKKFVALCHFFIGNNEVKKGDFSKAVSEYQSAILSDSTNAYIHFNLGVVLSVNKDTLNASKEYLLAQQLDHKFTDPSIKKESVKEAAAIKIKIDTKPKIIVANKVTTLEKYDTINAGVNIQQVPQKGSNEKIAHSPQYRRIAKNDKWGLINENGDTVLKCKYDVMRPFPYKERVFYIVKINSSFEAIDVAELKNTNMANWHVRDIDPKVLEQKIRKLVDTKEEERMPDQ